MEKSPWTVFQKPRTGDKPTRTDYNTFERINAALPQDVVNVLNMHGWNALGVYDLVKREMALTRKLTKQDEKP